MFTMIFVNDFAGVGKIAPDWMVHFSDRHEHGSGMTFVDLVFPGFLFVVGMSIPFALGSRLAKGEPIWKTLFHIITRTLALLLIGVLMVNDSPDQEAMGWLGSVYFRLMLLSAIFAFGSFSPRSATASAQKVAKMLTTLFRVAGFAALIYLAFAYRTHNGTRLISLAPFSLQTSWWGILGLIGWAYLVSSIVFLLFRGYRTALLGCMALLLCVFVADRKGAFDDLWLASHVSFGESLGSLASIAVGGLLLASILVSPDKSTHRSRLNFTLLFIVGCSVAALLLNGLYGISKNNATPSWCLWSCAITAALWLGFYYLCDVASIKIISKPFALAGQNVLLAYLISEMLPSFGGMTNSTLAGAIAGSAAAAFCLLSFTALLNSRGFRVKL
jgi:predicted acyltransferase